MEVFRRIETGIASLTMPENTVVEATIRTLSPALMTPKGFALQKALSSHTCSSHVGAASFATDGGNLASLGIQSLIFGPGSIDVAHKANEYVSREALLQGVEMVTAVIRDRCM